VISPAKLSICIVGLGQIGGSLAKAFRNCGVGREIVGVDRDEDTARTAMKERIVDAAFHDPEDAVRRRELVILAVPVREILRMIDPLSALMDDGAILLDVGSTKRSVLAEMKLVEGRIACIGGHPMCGTEAVGLSASIETLFRGVPFVLVPSSKCKPGELSTVVDLVKQIGAKPLFLSAENHDRIMATISHLPYVLAITLVRLCEELGADAQTAFELAAGGFLGATRLAESESLMASDFCLTNPDNIDSAMTSFVKKAEELLALSREGKADALFAVLNEARLKRRALREARQSQSEQPQSGQPLSGRSLSEGEGN